MSHDVIESMLKACERPVVIEELQAAACRQLSHSCGSEAAIVTCGAAASLMLGSAAILAGWDLAKMERLPDTSDMPNEFLIARAHRNGYDHAVRAAGGRMVEVGMDEVVSGAGVRRTEAWEYEVAMTSRTVGVVYVLTRDSQPPLSDVVRVAHGKDLPVLVDAAGQLPPVSNLRAICASGADLVCFSGGKAIGGPQASGILCGRRHLVGSAFLQMMDLDEHNELWKPPTELVGRSDVPGIPRHGIGRMLKVGKEQIIGLLAALDRFTEKSVDDLTDQRLHWLRRIQSTLSDVGVPSELAIGARPCLKIRVSEPACPQKARHACLALRNGTPSIYVNHARLGDGILVVEPSCLVDEEVPVLTRRLCEVLVASTDPCRSS